MMHYLASSSSNSLVNFFHQLGHDIAGIAKVSIVVVFIIAILLHFILTRRASATPQGIGIHHYIGAMIFGLGLAVVFPPLSSWLAHLTAGGRGGFDAIIIVTAFSDIIIQFAGRILSQGGGGEQ